MPRPARARKWVVPEGDRLKFQNDLGDFYEVYLEGDSLAVRTSGPNGPSLAVRPEFSNKVRIVMVRP